MAEENISQEFRSKNVNKTRKYFLSRDEFALINNVLKEYDNMKEEIET